MPKNNNDLFALSRVIRYSTAHGTSSRADALAIAITSICGALTCAVPSPVDRIVDRVMMAKMDDQTGIKSRSLFFDPETEY